MTILLPAEDLLVKATYYVSSRTTLPSVQPFTATLITPHRARPFELRCQLNHCSYSVSVPIYWHASLVLLSSHTTPPPISRFVVLPLSRKRTNRALLLRQPQRPPPNASTMPGSYQPDRPQPRKCQQCICGIQNDRGIWCAKLKHIPTRREVKRCRHFCPKALLDDDYSSEA